MASKKKNAERVGKGPNNGFSRNGSWRDSAEPLGKTTGCELEDDRTNEENEEKRVIFTGKKPTRNLLKRIVIGKLTRLQMMQSLMNPAEKRTFLLCLKPPNLEEQI